MRRIVAAVVTAVLITVTTAGPATAAPEQVPGYEISCSTLADPICPVIEQLKTLLAPLEQVLAVAAPLLGGMGDRLTLLTTLLERSPSIPAVELKAAASQVLGSLSILTDPLVALLSGLGLPPGPLTGALTQLEELARQGIETFTRQIGAAGSPTPAPAPAPAPAPSPAPGSPRASATSSGSPAPAQLGAPTPLPSSSGNRSVTFPGIRAGSTLQLSPLGLPRLSAPTPVVEMAELATESATTAAAKAASDRLVLPAMQAAAVPQPTGESRATAAALAIGALLLAAGLMIDQTRKARAPFQI